MGLFGEGVGGVDWGVRLLGGFLGCGLEGMGEGGMLCKRVGCISLVFNGLGC